MRFALRANDEAFGNDVCCANDVALGNDVCCANDVAFGTVASFANKKERTNCFVLSFCLIEKILSSLDNM